MTKTKQIIGSVSHGTMRKEDLIPIFFDTLVSVSKKRANQLLKKYELKSIPGCDSDENEWYEWEDSDNFLGDLFDILNEYAPPYFYFGASEGDGSDYGYFLSSDFGNEFNFGDGIKVNDLSEIPKGYVGEVLEINDHGNMSLYFKNKRNLKEIWGVV